MNYNEKINFLIAGAFSNYKRIVSHYIHNRKIYQKYNSITVYDGICNCHWNGGRPNNPKLNIYSKEIQEQKELYYKIGWKIGLTFSNPVIDLGDQVGNFLLKEFHKEGNVIILVNDNLRKYIREKFPKYTLTYSITGGPKNGTLGDEEVFFYKEKQKIYDTVIPRFEANLDIRLKELDLNKIEILVNDECVYNCQFYKEHYKKIAEINEKGLQDILSKEEIFNILNCWIKPEESCERIKQDKITYGENYGMMLEPFNIKRLLDLGVSKFKLQGRDEQTDPLIEDELNKYIVDYNKL